MNLQILQKYIGNEKFAPPEETIRLAINSKTNLSIWESITQRKDIQKYLSKLEKQEAIKLGREVNVWLFWTYILTKKDIPPKEAIELGKEIDDYFVWNTIMKRGDVKKYLEE